MAVMMPARATSPADTYRASCRPDSNAEYVAWMTSVTSLPWPAGAREEPLPADGSWPVRTPLITIGWMALGSPSRVRLATSAVCSLPITIAPRIATPITAPTSRLVFVLEAAIPDRSGGTAARTDEVIG